MVQRQLPRYYCIPPTGPPTVKRHVRLEVPAHDPRGVVDAAVADVDVRPGHHARHLVGGPSAEGAADEVVGRGHHLHRPSCQERSCQQALHDPESDVETFGGGCGVAEGGRRRVHGDNMAAVLLAQQTLIGQLGVACPKQQSIFSS